MDHLLANVECLIYSIIGRTNNKLEQTIKTANQSFSINGEN